MRESVLSDPTTTVRGAAEVLGVSAWSLYEAIKKGECPFPTISVGRRIVVPTAPLRQLLGIESVSDS